MIITLGCIPKRSKLVWVGDMELMWGNRIVWTMKKEQFKFMRKKVHRNLLTISNYQLYCCACILSTLPNYISCFLIYFITFSFFLLPFFNSILYYQENFTTCLASTSNWRDILHLLFFYRVKYINYRTY